MTSVSNNVQAFDKYRELEIRETELEELINHADGDVDALQQELDDIHDKMEELENEMMDDEESQ
mgnify:FL=1